MPKEQIRTTVKKAAMLEALISTLGVVTPALGKAEIERPTFYKWLKEDEVFAAHVEEISEIALDFSESKLYKLISDEIPSAVYFHLKTKGKARGYIERQEIDQTNDVKIEYVNVSKQFKDE